LDLIVPINGPPVLYQDNNYRYGNAHNWDENTAAQSIFSFLEKNSTASEPTNPEDPVTIAILIKNLSIVLAYIVKNPWPR
jgi:hypothetical protein